MTGLISGDCGKAADWNDSISLCFRAAPVGLPCSLAYPEERCCDESFGWEARLFGVTFGLLPPAPTRWEPLSCPSAMSP